MTKILLVEDNELNRDMLSRRLIKSGFDVIVAIDGAEGVEQAKSAQPDVILMDMSLPIIDGWAATALIKSDSLTCNIHVIALTAHAMGDDRQKALEAGCNDYDTKPIDYPRLLSKIQRFLEA